MKRDKFLSYISYLGGLLFLLVSTESLILLAPGPLLFFLLLFFTYTLYVILCLCISQKIYFTSKFLTPYIRFPKSPVYTYENGIVYEHTIKYEFWDDTRIALFPLLCFIRFDVLKQSDIYFTLTETDNLLIMSKSLTPEEMYMRYFNAYHSKLEEEWEKEKLLESINREYYNNFK